MRLTRVESSLPVMKISKANEPHLEADSEDGTLLKFERHFEQFWAPIYRLLRGMVGDPAEAEDLALEAMYRLYQKRADPQVASSTGGWLYRVATNLGLHSIRSFRRRERYEGDAGRQVFGETGETPQEIAAAEEERQLARRALAEMNPRQSQLLILRHSGMAYKDIAAVLHLSATSIGPLLVRAEREFEKRYRTLAREEL
jgi:RNA polymerase sigma factor (sigma-70 family)